MRFRLTFNVGREGEALRSAGTEFQTVGAMYPKERSLKIFRSVFGILSGLSVEERRKSDG